MEKNLRFEFEHVDSQNETQKFEVEFLKMVDGIDEELFKIDEKLASVGEDIERLTSHADWIDILSAITCGFLTGVLDNFLCDDFKFEIEDKENATTEQYTLTGLAENFIKEKTKSFNIENKISDLMKKLLNEKWLQKISTPNLSQQPSIIGLACSVLTQFTGKTYGINTDGITSQKVEDDTIIGKSLISKVFLGIVLWFLDVLGGIIKFDDIETEKKPNGATSWLFKLISEIPLFKEKGIKEDVLPGLKSIIIKIVNSDFFLKKEEKVSGAKEVEPPKDDGIFGGIFKDLAKKSLPVLINEISVRAIYFIRRLYDEIKEKGAINKVEWKNTLPIGNRTIERMITIASGVFTATDVVGVLICGATSTLKSWKQGLSLGLNIVGVGRFVIAGLTDIGMGIKKGIEERELLRLKNNALCLMQAKLYHGESLLWQAQKDVNQSIGSLINAIEQNLPQILQDVKATQESVEQIEKLDLEKVEQHNEGLLNDVLDIL